MKIAAIILGLILSSTLDTQESWMRHLSDTLYASQILIPGAHDSATGEGMRGVLKLGITQQKSIAEQWACGIRAFDFRPAINRGCLHIYHGSLKTKITLSAAIDTLLKCIEKNPSEFAIVLLRQERGSSDPAERNLWSKLIGEQINKIGDRAALFHPKLTVGCLRGKILFLSRNHYSGSNKGARIEGWSHSADGTKNAKIIPYNKESLIESPQNVVKNATLYIQDFYSPTSQSLGQKKIETIKQFIDDSQTAAPETWIINHLSGYSSTLFNIKGVATNRGYKQNASTVNSTIHKYLKEKRAERANGGERNRNNHPKGIILIDYAGCEKTGRYATIGKSIIEAIIEQNFDTE